MGEWGQTKFKLEVKQFREGGGGGVHKIGELGTRFQLCTQ